MTSQWAIRRARLVDDVVNGITMVAAAKNDPELARDTMLAMRDAIKDLRAYKEAWDAEKEALVEEIARLEDLVLNPPA